MKIQKILLFLCLFLSIGRLFVLPGTAAEIYVDDSNLTGIEDGSTLHPYNTIQEAVAASSSETGEDTIRAAGGSYTGNITIQDRTVHLYGGYPGGTPADYENGTGGVFTGRDIAASVTWIQGDGTGPAVSLIDAGASTVDGCRITGGSGFETEYTCHGGGIYVSGGSPVISQNTIETNDARSQNSPDLRSLGGGIFSGDSDITVSGNTVRTNSAGGGGGIAIDGGTVVITGNTVQANIAYGFAHGGGLLVNSPDARITGNRFIGNEVGRDQGYGWGGGAIVYGETSKAVFSGNIYKENYAASAGGGLFVDDGADAAIDHELIYNNESARNGAGIYVDGAWDEIGSRAAFSHCTIAENVCTDSGIPGKGMAVEYYSTVTIQNSIFWGNGGDDLYADDTSGLSVTYTLSEETVLGQGNLNANPLFTDSANGDFHLQSTAGRWHETDSSGEWLTDNAMSPAVDAADPVSDYTSEPAPNGSRANMGVYGNTAEASKSGTTAPPAETVNFSGFTQSDNPRADAPVSITVTAREQNSRPLFYRFSTRTGYGTAGYDAAPWQLMTSSEYQTRNSCEYTIDSSEKRIIVVWATASDTTTVDPTGIPIIGWSVDPGTGPCRINFTGLDISGTAVTDTALSFTVHAQSSCSTNLYYRFAMHPDYGTPGYDGRHWSLMADSEWITDNSMDYTFTRTGKYIVVVWVSDTDENVDSTGIPILGCSVDVN